MGLRNIFFCAGLLAAFALLQGCTGEFTPKPRAYPRVNYPAKKYELFSPADCPFQFEKPVYTNTWEDSVFRGKIMKLPCWLNVGFPDFNGTINLTYKEINDTTSFEKLVGDAHKLSFNHTKKADYIDEILIHNPYGVGGILYDVGGNAASQVQFFLTDSNRHFIRGSLYFYNPPDADSMAPVVAFVKEDMEHMLRTFQWK
jgi:gliding motility-associated lipoprotein GldD